MSTVERITSVTGENTRLLTLLSQTEHAKVSLAQHDKYIANLRREIAAAEDHLHSLQKTMHSCTASHEKYRDSTMRRLASRLAGSKRAEQFAAKEAKQEREYLAAVHAEWRFRQTRDAVEKRLVSALKEREELVEMGRKHEEAKKELEGLYGSIFDGPTPEFPEEDEAERPFRDAKKEFDECQASVQATGQAVILLNDAVREMQSVVKELEGAPTGLKGDLKALGTQFTDIPSRDTLNRARMHATHCSSLFGSAQQCDPNIPAIPIPQIAQGRLISDALFDGFLTDAVFTEKMLASVEECRRVLVQYEVALDECRTRRAKLRREGEIKKKALDEARVKLFDVRRAVIMKIVNPA